MRESTAAAVGAAPVAAPARPRMALANITRGKRDRPLRVVIAGVDKVGKSTFASNAPAPVFLGAEEGTDALDVPRFPAPTNWKDVLDAIEFLTVEQHEYQTLVIDTLDWMEPLIWQHVCAAGGKVSIEDFGFGKGYVAALDEWRILLAALERMRNAKPVNVVMIAHTQIKAFKSPDSDDYDRYEMKLHTKAAALVREWADVVLFATYETYAVKDDRTKRVKGISTGARVVHTVRTAAWDAGSRYALPVTLPLSWPSLAAAIASNEPADPEKLIAAITENAPLLPEEMKKQTADALGRCGKDAVKLAQLDNWVRAQLAATSE